MMDDAAIPGLETESVSVETHPCVKPMERALHLAEEAARRGEVPVAAVLLDARGREIAAAANETEKTRDPTAHAEILAIRKACEALRSPRLPAGCRLYVTLEPCAMCAAAISYSRIDRLIFGAYDTKMGAIENGVRLFQSESALHRPAIFGGVEEEKAKALLQRFFRNRRVKSADRQKTG